MKSRGTARAVASFRFRDGATFLGSGDAGGSLCRRLGDRAARHRGTRSGDARRSGAALPSALAVGRPGGGRARCAGAQLSRAGRCAAICALFAAAGRARPIGDAGGAAAADPAAGAGRRSRSHPTVRSGRAAEAGRAGPRSQRPALRTRRAARCGVFSVSRLACRGCAARRDRPVPYGGRLGRRTLDPARIIPRHLRATALLYIGRGSERPAGRQPGRVPVLDGGDGGAGRRARSRHHRGHDDRASRRRAGAAGVAAAEGRARLALDAGGARHALVPHDAALSSADAGRLGARDRRCHHRSFSRAGVVAAWPVSPPPPCPCPGANCWTR